MSARPQMGCSSMSLFMIRRCLSKPGDCALVGGHGKSLVSESEMDPFVTPSAHCDQVLFRIITELAARLNVMHLELTHRSAMLAAPRVSFQYFFPQFVVRDRIQP
jgi:hypothetical protein